MSKPLLSVQNLVTSFQIDGQKVAAVDGVSFDIYSGQTVGLVGESGCGKSVSSLSIMRLVESPPGSIDAGKIFFEDRDLLSLKESEMRQVRGNSISMIFQEPMTSLNPVFTIGNQISEVFELHQNLNKKEARQKSIEMLRMVNIPAPEQRVDEYPHQLSGGMRQRVMIAMALACQPKLLIADEPTTALDVTIQAQILSLMNRLQEELGMAILMITHDLGVVAEVCDYVMVMYGGKIIEQGTVEDLFTNVKHPYTKGLLASIPKLGSKVERLATIQGIVPPLGHWPQGCRFRDRCKEAKEQCKKVPPKVNISEQHGVSCWLYADANDDGKGANEL